MRGGGRAFQAEGIAGAEAPKWVGVSQEQMDEGQCDEDGQGL